MAEKNDSGDKTEKPTPKRLQDARKKGDVAKSKDLTSTVGLFAWLLLAVFATGFAVDRVMGLFDRGLAAVAAGPNLLTAIEIVGRGAFLTFLLLTALALAPVAAISLVAEFLQTGAILTTEKLKPSLDKLNPMEGLKRMVSMDNLVELLKTMAKAGLILGVTWVVIRAALPDVLGKLGAGVLPTQPGAGRGVVASVLSTTGSLSRQLLGWTLGVFFLVAVLDVAYQRHSYTKKLRMSRRDIKQEFKENEGDPHIKSSRKQMHQEWANQNAIQSARSANVLIVNPTHLAIALDYDPEDCPVPVIAAKGEGPLAQAMREAAEEAGVPVIQNIDVARALWERGDIDSVIPKDMFEAVAEIILWARRARDEIAAARKAHASARSDMPARLPGPGDRP